MRYTRATFAALGASALLFACAIDVGPFFTPPEIPENQLAFNGGKIGLLTPALTKENELIAFRLLSGLRMDQGSASTGGRRAAVAARSGNDQLPGQEAWLEKRRTIHDPPAPILINEYRTKSSGDQYVYYENCLADAFLTAARTLGGSPAKLWVGRSD